MTTYYLYHHSLMWGEREQDKSEEEADYPTVTRISAKQVEYSFWNPSSLIFEVTEDCNLRCEYCAYGPLYKQPKIRPLFRGKKMSWEIASVILDNYVSHWHSCGVPSNRNINVCFYGGEPLTNISLIKKIVQYIKDFFPPQLIIRYYITTNGVLINQHISYLFENNFVIKISLDGNETANSFRLTRNSKPSFNTVYSNVRNISLNYPQFYETNIFFQAVITSKEHVSDVIKFFSEKLNKVPEIMELSKTNLVDQDSIKHYYRSIYSDISENIQQSEGVIPEFNLEQYKFVEFQNAIALLSDTIYIDYLDFFSRSNKQISATCIPFSSKVFFSADGYIFPCERTAFDFPLGRVSGGQLELNMNEIVEKYNSVLNNNLELCKQCVHKYMCNHCFVQDEDSFNENLRCSSFESFDEGKLDDIAKYIKENTSLFKYFKYL